MSASAQIVNRTMNPAEWSMLLALSVLWGGSFFFNGVAVRELPTFTVVVCRVALAAIILLVVMRIMGQRMPWNHRIWGAFLVMGLLNNALPFSLIVWGQMHIASGLASILNATTPLFTVIAAQLFTKDEKMTPGRLLGVIVGFAGVAVMIGGDGPGAFGFDIVAQIAVLGAAVSYALAGVFGRRFQRLGLAPMATATGQVTASSILLLPLLLIVDQPWTLPVPSLAAVAALIGVAALSTALAYILYFRILANAGATNLLLVTFLIPVSAILLGVLVLHETLSPMHLFGMAMIGLGLAAIDGRPWRMARRFKAT
ncbi:MAG: DMT family transporter [Alphaproteobacteria bacterium]|jgi:drug/metabolite transporter (DMT)-like permease|nr:DMT family transporter [Alphaproteobacteria bacterium]MDP6832277.1 DMT family transporter [Alphaproteobacteria bacterium]